MCSICSLHNLLEIFMLIIFIMLFTYVPILVADVSAQNCNFTASADALTGQLQLSPDAMIIKTPAGVLISNSHVQIINYLFSMSYTLCFFMVKQ